jgi:hypothetical protein
MLEKIVKVALVVALCAAVVFGIVKGYEWWRSGVYNEGHTAGQAQVQEQWNKDKLARAAARDAAVATARDEERRIAAQAAQGERRAREDAERKADADRAAAAGAAAAHRGLSGKLASLDGAARATGVPDAASCPAQFARQRDEAVLARELLGSCASRYRELGEAVDAAWTAIELRLDTALGWIRATGAP